MVKPALYVRLSLMLFLVYAPVGAFWPMFTLWLKKLGFSPLEIAVATATQAIGALFAPLLAGQVADRWLSAERCLALFAFLIAGLLVLLAGATSTTSLFVCGLAFWMLMVPLMTLGNSICFAHLPSPEAQFGRIRLWGTIGWVSLVWVVACALWHPPWLMALVGQFRPEKPSIELPDMFHFGAVSAIVLGFYALTLPATPPREQAREAFAPLEALRLLRQRDFILFFGCYFALCLTVPFSTQNTILLLDELGIDDAWKGPVMTIAQATEVASLLGLPWLLRLLGLRCVMVLGAASWALSLVVLAIGSPAGLVVSCLGLNGFFITGYIVAGQMFVNSRADSEVRASAQALISFTSGIGMLAGYAVSGVVGHLVGGAFRPTFTLAALVALLAAGGFAVWFHPETE